MAPGGHESAQIQNGPHDAPIGELDAGKEVRDREGNHRVGILVNESARGDDRIRHISRRPR